MNPTVSVVIPAFNHARFVAEAITSVLSQSFADLEVLVTDDGSNDGTADIVGKFSDARVKLEVFPENRGAVIALNSAIRRSRGEYICFLASDDCFLPGKLEKQVAFLAKTPGVAAVFGLPVFIDEGGNPLRADQQFNGDVFEVPFREQLVSRDDWLRFFFFNGNCLCHPAAMVRRSAYDTAGLYDPRLANLPDFDMWVRLVMLHDIAVMHEPLTAMRIHGNNANMSAPRRDTLLRGHFETYEILKHYRKLTPESLRRIFKHEIASHHLDGDGQAGFLLARIALTSPSPIHALFGLDAIFENIAATDGEACRMLIDLSGRRDIFGIDIANRLSETEAARLSQKDESEEKIASLSESLRDEIASLNETLRRERALGQSYQRKQAELERVIKLSAEEIAGLQRSRTFGLVKLQKSFRRRIERLAAALRLPDVPPKDEG